MFVINSEFILAKTNLEQFQLGDTLYQPTPSQTQHTLMLLKDIYFGGHTSPIPHHPLLVVF